MNVIQTLPDWGAALNCTPEEWQETQRLTRAYLPKLIPDGWIRTIVPKGHPMAGIFAWHHRDGRGVVFSVGEWDGKLWLHASVSRRDRMPSYEDLVDLKTIWIGPHRQAIQVFPRKTRHVNLHSHCLHLWACVDPEGDGLPDFGKHGTI